MSRPTFELMTSRLRLRELTPDDAPWFRALNDDPIVKQFTGDDPFPDDESARRFLENYDAYACFGMGRWAVEGRETREPLGWCGLRWMPTHALADLGFRFLPAVRNRGFATESGRACLEHGHGALGLKTIVGRCVPENFASRRVLEKLGFRDLGLQVWDGQELATYRSQPVMSR